MFLFSARSADTTTAAHTSTRALATLAASALAVTGIGFAVPSALADDGTGDSLSAPVTTDMAQQPLAGDTTDDGAAGSALQTVPEDTASAGSSPDASSEEAAEEVLEESDLELLAEPEAEGSAAPATSEYVNPQASIANPLDGVYYLGAQTDSSKPETFIGCEAGGPISRGEDGSWTLNLDDPATTGAVDTVSIGRFWCETSDNPITSVTFTGNADGHIKTLELQENAFTETPDSGPAGITAVHFPVVDTLIIGQEAFNQYGHAQNANVQAALKTIDFPEGIKTLKIDKFGFAQFGDQNQSTDEWVLTCAALESVRFPESLTTLDIGYAAFWQDVKYPDCQTTLKNVDIPGTNLQELSLGDYAFFRNTPSWSYLYDTRTTVNFGWDEDGIPAMVTVGKSITTSNNSTYGARLIWNGEPGATAKEDWKAAGEGDFTMYGATQMRFDANGGENAPATAYGRQNFEVKEKSFEITVPAEVPTKDGLKFAGWKTPDGSVLQPGDIYMPKAYRTTVTAQWTDPTVMTIPENTCEDWGPVTRGEDGSWNLDMDHESLKDVKTLKVGKQWKCTTDNPITSVHFTGNADGHITTLQVLEYAFYETPESDQAAFLTEVHFPVVENLLVDDFAFMQFGHSMYTNVHAALKVIDFPEGIRNLTIGRGGFAETTEKSQIDKSYVLQGTSLESVSFPDSLTSLKIGESGFTQFVLAEGLPSLTKVEIPGNLETLEIGNGAFLRQTDSAAKIPVPQVVRVAFDADGVPANFSMNDDEQYGKVQQRGWDYFVWAGPKGTTGEHWDYEGVTRNYELHGQQLLQFDGNGGAGAPAKIWSNSETSPDDPFEFTIPGDVPTLDGKEFAGWETPDGSLVQPGATYAPTAWKVTLKATWQDPKPVDPTKDDPIRFKRLFGSNRYETASAANAWLPSTSDTVFVATGENFPDALSAAPAAAKKKAALYLSHPATGLSDADVKAIKDSGASKLVILGGPQIVPEKVEQQLPQIKDVNRIAGNDRYETSAQIVDEFFPECTKFYVATGLNFADALSVGSLAASEDAPVLLVNGKLTNGYTDAQKEILSRASGVTILAGPQVVDASYEADLPVTPTRIAGKNRYETSQLISALQPEHSDTVWTVTGENFPDALVASALAGRTGCPVVLANLESPETRAFTEAAMPHFEKPQWRLATGGDGVLSDASAKAGLPEGYKTVGDDVTVKPAD